MRRDLIRPPSPSWMTKRLRPLQPGGVDGEVGLKPIHPASRQHEGRLLAKMHCSSHGAFDCGPATRTPRHEVTSNVIAPFASGKCQGHADQDEPLNRATHHTALQRRTLERLGSSSGGGQGRQSELRDTIGDATASKRCGSTHLATPTCLLDISLSQERPESRRQVRPSACCMLPNAANPIHGKVSCGFLAWLHERLHAGGARVI
jgi:hypothetical protein